MGGNNTTKMIQVTSHEYKAYLVTSHANCNLEFEFYNLNLYLSTDLYTLTTQMLTNRKYIGK